MLQIQLDVANFGANSVDLRIAFRGGLNNTCYGSAQAVTVMTGGVWQPVVFELNDTASTVPVELQNFSVE